MEENNVKNNEKNEQSIQDLKLSYYYEAVELDTYFSQNKIKIPVVENVCSFFEIFKTDLARLCFRLVFRFANYGLLPDLDF